MIAKAAFFVLGLGTLVLWVSSRFTARASKKRRPAENGPVEEFFAIVCGLIAGIKGFVASPTEPLFITVGVALLVLALLSDVLWRLADARERRQLGCCPACGYDLTGNVSGRCPECGKETEPVE